MRNSPFGVLKSEKKKVSDGVEIPGHLSAGIAKNIKKDEDKNYKKV